MLWIVSLSLKDPATIADGRLIPADWTFDNYKSLFEGGLDSPLLKPLINSIVIALIATTIAIVLASFTAYAIARLEFPGKLADPRRRAGDRDVPADLDRRPAVRHVAQRSASTTPTRA